MEKCCKVSTCSRVTSHELETATARDEFRLQIVSNYGKKKVGVAS